MINAFIVPCVYFFYPETAYRSLEEMDEIFHKTTSIFDAVKVARDMPRRYGKNGELLVDYFDTEAAQGAERRRSSITGGRGNSIAGAGAKSGVDRREKAEAGDVMHDEGRSSSSKGE